MSDWDDEDEYVFDETRPISYAVTDVQPDEAMMDFFEYRGLQGSRFNEGAIFHNFEDAFVIAVYGGQPLHHDRHIDREEGMSNDTWNLQVSGEGGQMLVCEVAQSMFTHIPLIRGQMVYLETRNRHLVTRTNPKDVSIMVQVQGYGPDEHEKALEHIQRLYENACNLRRSA